MSLLCSAPVRAFRSRAVVMALLTFAVVGCGRGDVSGKVTYKGKNLVWGTVQLEGSDGLVKHGNIQRDGTYSIKSVATGTAKAAVSSINPTSSDFQPIHREGQPPPQVIQARKEIKGWFPIPAKYDRPFNSGLTYEVKRGENTIDIDLE